MIAALHGHALLQQAHVGFVDKSRGLQCVFAALPAEIAASKTVQFVVYVRENVVYRHPAGAKGERGRRDNSRRISAAGSPIGIHHHVPIIRRRHAQFLEALVLGKALKILALVLVEAAAKW